MATTWTPLMVDWSLFSQEGKIQAIRASVSSDSLDKLAIRESEDKQVCLEIVANKHASAMTLEYLTKNSPYEEVRQAAVKRLTNK